MGADNEAIPETAIQEVEIDILEFAERGEQVPHARAYRVRIDGETVKLDTPSPTGEELLHRVGKRPCAFELIAEFRHHENCVIEAHEKFDLRRHGLKGFITAHKEIVTIFINNDPYKIERGEHTVAQILQKVGQTPEGYVLLEEKGGPPLPVPTHGAGEDLWLRTVLYSASVRSFFVADMSYPQEQIDELKRYCTKLSALTEGGTFFIHLEGLRLPAGCTPATCDALLCPAAKDGYPSRLYFSASIVAPYPKNWNVSGARIGERNWWAFSWRVDLPSPSLPQLLIAHLNGFIKQ